MERGVRAGAFQSLDVVALAGGVGGAKLAYGLSRLLSPDRFAIIVNTGDDFEHLGLTICPDLDTVTYTLAERANPETGWGLVDETFNCLAAVESLGGPTWFRLGDRDLATHLMRTQALREGARLTAVIEELAHAMGIAHRILPMTDDICRTQVLTDEGTLPFQEYFVKRHWEPVVRGFRWEGIERAEPTPEVLTSLKRADLVVICPSNPFVSIDPILMLPGVREAVREKPAVAVSPILGGDVVKGPAAKMCRELGVPVSAVSVARHYEDFLDGFVLDVVDRDLIPRVEALGMAAQAMPTMMKSVETRVEVARGVLHFAVTRIVAPG
jgi:LPPG:FO 2-phospho-L-lactate transferase